MQVVTTPMDEHGPRCTILTLWALVVFLSSPVWFIGPVLFINLFGGPSLSDPWLNIAWLLLLIPGLPFFWAVGRLQQAAHEAKTLKVANGWTRRTMIGGELGLLAYILALWLLRAVYDGGPVVNSWGLLMINGDPVEATTTISGWALAGAIYGLAQWPPWRFVDQERWAGVRWCLVSAFGWGAGAVANWTLFKFFVIGDESVCISCVMRVLMCVIAAVLVISVAQVLALLHLPFSLAFNLIVYTGAALLLLISPTPIFLPRELHPYRVLQNGETMWSYPFVEAVAFSDDGKILGVIRSEKNMGVNTSTLVLLWRTSDWKQVATLESGETSERVEAEPGVSSVAEITANLDTLYIRRDSDRSILTTISFYDVTGTPPKGYAFTAPSGYEKGQLQTPSGQIVSMSAYPVENYLSPNRVRYDYSPDGRYIAAGYEIGGSWVWRIP